MRRRRVIAALGAAAAFALTLNLGNWQTHRADDKAARQAQWDAALAQVPTEIAGAAALARVSAQLPQRVRLRGRFVHGATIFIDNRTLDGVAGLLVITPVALGADTPWVLVNRGWAPRDMTDRSALPAVAGADDPVVVEGMAVERIARVLDLGTGAAQLGAAWQNLDYAAFEQASGHAVARFVVQQTSDAADGLKRVWPRPDAGVDKHRGYAFQWYALAALIAAFAIYFVSRALKRA